MLRLQQWFYGLGESDDVGVIAYQFYLSFGEADDLDDVDGAYLGSVLVQFVQIGNDLFLIRDGHVEPAEVGILLYHFHKVFDAWNFEVHVFCINILCFELLIEKSDRKRMFQRVTY